MELEILGSERGENDLGMRENLKGMDVEEIRDRPILQRDDCRKRMMRELRCGKYRI